MMVWSLLFTPPIIQPIGDYELIGSVDLSYSDEVYRQGDLDPVSREDAVTKVNGALTFSPASGQWEVSLVGKNLTDQTTYSYVNDTPLFNGTRQGRLDAPRSISIRGLYRF